VNAIKETLNLNESDTDAITPIICGTVVKGPAFERKLRMMRADLFSLLSVSNANTIISSKKQTQAIHKGVQAILDDTQDCTMQDILDMSQGWQAVMLDKCFNNEVTGVEVVNMPYEVKNWKEPKLPEKARPGDKIPYQPCSTFVYAAYLPPGL